MTHDKQIEKVNEIKEKHPAQIGIVVYADGNGLMPQVGTTVVAKSMIVFCDSIALFARRLYLVFVFQ